MKKQFLRVKQIADQTFLRAEKTEVLNEDLISAEKRVDLIKQTCQSTGKKMAACLLGVGSETISVEKKMKKMPDTALAQSMQEYSVHLGESSILGNVLGECSGVQGLLAKELVNYEADVERNVLLPLFQLLENEIPNIAKLRKQLAKLTLDMDASRTRYQTAIRHSSASSNVTTTTTKADGLKEELEDASMKMEQCRDALAAEMFALISREPELAQLFVHWYQLQADYHRTVLTALDSSLPTLQDMIKQFPQKPVFGCSLEEHLRMSKRQIASVIEACVCFLIMYGINEEGLFRIAGSSSKVKKLKNAFDASVVDMTEYIRDPHAVAGVLKSYLRELPEPLTTFALYDEWMDAAKISEQESRLQALRQVVNKLPEQNFENLRYVVKFLATLATNSDCNKMSPQNIAIVIAPNLIWMPVEDGSMQFSANMSVANTHSSVIDSLVTYADWFFPGEVEFFLTSSILQNLPDIQNGEIESDVVFESHSPKSLSRPSKKTAPPVPPVPTVQIREKPEKTHLDRSSSFGSHQRMSTSMTESSCIAENNKYEHKWNRSDKMFSTLPHKIADKQDRHISVHRIHDSLLANSDKTTMISAKGEKPDIPEKPVAYSTCSLERHRRIERPDHPPPAAPRLSKMAEKPILENTIHSENGIATEKNHFSTVEKPPKPAKPVLPLIAENSNGCQLDCKSNQAQLYDFKSKVDELPISITNEINQENLVKNKIGQNERIEDNIKHDKWDFLISQTSEKPPDRPPRTTSVCHDRADLTENFGPPPQKPPRSVSPQIGSSYNMELVDSKTPSSPILHRIKPPRPQPPPPPPPPATKPRVASAEDTRL